MNILITGAGKGIGYETLKKIKESGNHKLIAIVRNKVHAEKLNALNNKKEIEVLPYIFDLENDDFSPLLAFVEKHFRNIDIIINNAGLLINKTFNELSLSDYDKIMTVNLKAPFLLLKTLFPLIKNGSHVVNIGSMGGFMGSAKYKGLSVYSASKGALAILSECLAEEWKENNISVNCLALGATQTEMLTTAFPDYKALISAEDMAKFIAEFALNGHKFFNGKIIPVSLSTP